MNRLKKSNQIRAKLQSGEVSIGTWMQIPDSSIAEILSQSDYDWVTVDLEHGAISAHQLPELFRSLELGNTLPLARVVNSDAKECKKVLDAGAGGVILPMINSAQQLIDICDACCWPPTGKRGVGFSRANLFGKNFDEYIKEAQSPLIVAMIEHINAVESLEEILTVDGLDAIFVGPYDLSASMGCTAEFDEPKFVSTIERIINICKQCKIPCGIHVVAPDEIMLKQYIKDGFQFIAYSIDAVFLQYASKYPM